MNQASLLLWHSSSCHTYSWLQNAANKSQNVISLEDHHVELRAKQVEKSDYIVDMTCEWSFKTCKFALVFRAERFGTTFEKSAKPAALDKSLDSATQSNHQKQHKDFFQRERFETGIDLITKVACSPSLTLYLGKIFTFWSKITYWADTVVVVVLAATSSIYSHNGNELVLYTQWMTQNLANGGCVNSEGHSVNYHVYHSTAFRYAACII